MTTMKSTMIKSPMSATPSWLMYRTLVGIGLICALVVVTVFEVTFPIIKINQQQALENALYQVLPNAKSFTTYALDDDNHFQKAADDNTFVLYACYDINLTLIGFAIPARGMGYQDTIELLYGFSMLKQTIEGLVILQNRETPGLGNKIEGAKFLHNFSSVEVDLQHPLELIKTASKSHSRQIDSITGATISSQAVVSIMNRSLEFWIPLITQNKERFTLEH
jgi:electron transport complex protein RnfG